MLKIALTIMLAAFSPEAQEPLRIVPSGTLYAVDGEVALYPEGFVLERGQRLSFSGVGVLKLPAGAHVVALEDALGGTVTDTVRVIQATPPRQGSPRARVLCVGESTTESVSAEPYTGTKEAGWNWVSMMRHRARADGVDVLCLGTGTVTGEAAYTAHGGWSAYTYLNWPCAAKMDPHAPSHFFTSEAMWYVLGLRTRTGKPYQGEGWQHDLMARTPFGKYPPDGDRSLWNFVRSVGGRYGYPDFAGSGEYKGTRRQDKALRQWAEALARNPLNEFYSLEAAVSGDSAFSLEAYLERYRTLDDAGIRLPAASDRPAGERVRGSDGKWYTVGSRIVTRKLLEKVSVCTPTHVVVNIGINDGDSQTSVEAAAEGLVRLMQCFAAFPSAHFVNRWPGACYPSLWAPGSLPRQYGINGNNTRVIAIMKQFCDWAEDSPQCDALDVWHTQHPASQLQEKVRDGVLICNVDDVHTGYAGQQSSAWQVLGWLYTQLSR